MQPMTTALEQSRELFFTGVGHFEAGRLLQARASFVNCLALTPERASVHGNLGITLFYLGLPRESVAHLQKATAGDPEHREAWACLGLAHDANGNWQLAIDALTRALGLSDRSPALWFSKGQCLMRLGRMNEALQAFDRSVDIDPTFAAAWSARGGLLREMHQLEEAAKSFEKALALGADLELNAYYLASVRGVNAPATAPRHYVEALFDDYAADFQSHLVEKLGYRGYEVLLRPVIESGERFHSALDLGCGTGLCAALIQTCVDTIDGIDISSEMLEQAEKLGIYRELLHEDLAEFLARTQGRADLVIAADVLIYVGELSSIFQSIGRILEPGGLFAFTVELTTNDKDCHLLPSLRYAHSESYLRRLAAQCGLQCDDLRIAPIRYEQSVQVQGLYAYLRKPWAVTQA